MIDPRVAALCAEFGICIVDRQRYPEPRETRAPETLARILRKHGENHLRLVLSTLAETANHQACLDEVALWTASDMVRVWQDAIDDDASKWLEAWDALPVGLLQFENIQLRGKVSQRFALGGQLHERLYRLFDPTKRQGDLFDDRRRR